MIRKTALALAALLLAVLMASCVIQLPAGSAPEASDGVQPSSFPTLLPGSSATAPTPASDIRNDEALSYFSEIALKSEYGGDAFEGIVRRWEEPIRFEINGKYTQEDYAVLVHHFEALKAIDGMPDISIVESGGNYVVHFVPLAQMASVVPGYVEGNWGFVNLSWDERGRISRATVGIATDVTSQVQRDHLILEETTQGLGLLNDSPRYMDSIYQVEWTEVQSLTPMDWLLVKMLYSPVVRAGMKQDEALPALKAWLVPASD